MPSFLYGELTQRMPNILMPRYRVLGFENGDLIPTQTNLIPGMREVAYERFSEFGDADLTSLDATNIPVVDIGMDEDRYPVAAIASGFRISLQEERAAEAMSRTTLGRGDFDRFEARMSAARRVIAQRIDRITAFGRPSVGVAGLVNNPLLTVNSPTAGVGGSAGASSLGQSSYNQLCDFFADQIQAITDNMVSEEPTMALISPAINRRLSVQNANGTKSVRSYLKEEFPNLRFRKTAEMANAQLAVNGVTTTGNRDRMIFYPNMGNILHRQIEQSIAQLVPEDYIRVDGLNKIYTMFSCVTGVIIDYPQDVRIIDVFVA